MKAKDKFKVELTIMGAAEDLNNFRASSQTSVDVIIQEAHAADLPIHNLCYTYAVYNKLLSSVYTGFDVTYQEILEFAYENSGVVDFRGDVKRYGRHHANTLDQLFENYIKHACSVMLLSKEKFEVHRQTVIDKHAEYARNYPIDFMAICGYPEEYNFGFVSLPKDKGELSHIERWSMKTMGCQYPRPISVRITTSSPTKHIYRYTVFGGESYKFMEVASRRFNLQIKSEVTDNTGKIETKYFVCGKERPFAFIK